MTSDQSESDTMARLLAAVWAISVSGLCLKSNKVTSLDKVIVKAWGPVGTVIVQADLYINSNLEQPISCSNTKQKMKVAQCACYLTYAALLFGVS